MELIVPVHIPYLECKSGILSSDRAHISIENGKVPIVDGSSKLDGRVSNPKCVRKSLKSLLTITCKSEFSLYCVTCNGKKSDFSYTLMVFKMIFFVIGCGMIISQIFIVC